MALLITVADLLTSMGMKLDNEEALTDTITSAIETATARIEAELGTLLHTQTTTEIFNPDPDLFAGVIPNGLFTLKLRNMFLSGTPQVYSMETINGSPTLIPATDYLLDTEKGIVRVVEGYTGLFIKVVYTSGFVNYKDTIPAIKQAIMAVAPIIFRASQINTEAADAPASNQAGNLTLGLLSRYTNPVGFAYRCLHYS